MESDDLREEFSRLRGLIYELFIKEDRLVADISKLQASVAKFTADVDALLAKPSTPTQSDLDALQTAVDAEDAKVVAALSTT